MRIADIDERLRVGPLELANRVFAAPLSGVSDVPFRRLARRFGAGLVVSEMVASGEFVKGAPEGRLRSLRDGPGIHTVQLAGRDPSWMEEAARRLADTGVDLIDINMGCPAKKVVGGLSGSALMREPELALRIVEATVRGAGSVPVSLKMRLGWSRTSINAAEIAAKAQAAGVVMLTVHGRTREDFYEGRADWPAIGDVKAAVSVPVVANGDVVSAAQVPQILAASGADAIMIGRGMQGRMWLPGLLSGATTRARLAAIDAGDFICEHYEAMLSHYGERTGLRHARKHIGWYLDRHALADGPIEPARRGALMTERDPHRVLGLLRAIFSGTSLADLEFGKAARLHTCPKAA
ncbi:tRNA dihydrouridine synthase DusB [Fulvimarina sp. 2208YS6-2-32]|uniref:tRNA-dihydrouridine synthase n=1 Tax=Fulvimarina uroteuthidis TaxID=3098149 RepID=A0ABU5I621_9HYPH|nr:tRNA dihydrouridine synthase DusB [Fulvimarina sp. 2208YS6-2-32]MDY8110358.1 tRNA dihydrouridine synthase DusB [Fulvimarina sp. 2208YS6-2-32]